MLTRRSARSSRSRTSSNVFARKTESLTSSSIQDGAGAASALSVHSPRLCPLNAVKISKFSPFLFFFIEAEQLVRHKLRLMQMDLYVEPCGWGQGLHTAVNGSRRWTDAVRYVGQRGGRGAHTGLRCQGRTRATKASCWGKRWWCWSGWCMLQWRAAVGDCVC